MQRCRCSLDRVQCVAAAIRRAPIRPPLQSSKAVRPRYERRTNDDHFDGAQEHEPAYPAAIARIAKASAPSTLMGRKADRGSAETSRTGTKKASPPELSLASGRRNAARMAHSGSCAIRANNWRPTNPVAPVIGIFIPRSATNDQRLPARSFCHVWRLRSRLPLRPTSSHKPPAFLRECAPP